jgi:RNA polymerase sigma-70 factor, ECF subfamily
MRKRDESGLCVNHLTDEELIARCGDGDRRAMDVLVSRYHAKLLDFALRHLNDREASADVAQVTLVRVFENARGFERRASFKTWLYAVALNQIRDEYRKRGRKRESLAASLEECAEALTDVPDESEAGRSPEDQVLGRMEATMVWQAVDTLSDDHRSAIIMRFRQGLTYEEIAAVMEVPSGTVRSWVYHSLRALKRSLGPMKCED